MSNPLILTLKPDEQAQQFFNALRKAHFPAHANYLDAHLTLFHLLPDANDTVIRCLETTAQRSPFKPPSGLLTKGINVLCLLNYQTMYYNTFWAFGGETCLRYASQTLA